MTTLGAIAVGWKAARQAKTSTRSSRFEITAKALIVRIFAALGTVLGLACFVVAAWTVAIPLGLLVAGLSLFVLEWRLTE